MKSILDREIEEEENISDCYDGDDDYIMTNNYLQILKNKK
jgi:hypothetical protein